MKTAPAKRTASTRRCTRAWLETSIAAERHESDELYPNFAATARSEGFGHIADWFESLARAERQHLDRLREAGAPP